MQAFCDKHEARIAGVLSCFDRMLFRGYLPIMHGAAMAQFLRSEEVNCGNLRQFLLETSECLTGLAVDPQWLGAESQPADGNATGSDAVLQSYGPVRA